MGFYDKINSSAIDDTLLMQHTPTHNQTVLTNQYLVRGTSLQSHIKLTITAVKQGVARAGHNTTRLQVAWRHRLACRLTVECYRRRQTPATATSLAPYTMCRRASNNSFVSSEGCWRNVNWTVNILTECRLQNGWFLAVPLHHWYTNCSLRAHALERLYLLFLVSVFNWL